MFRLLVLNQIYTEVALKRSANTAQSAPYGSWLSAFRYRLPQRSSSRLLGLFKIILKAKKDLFGHV